MKVTRFEDLEIWKEARELCQVVFKLSATDKFIKEFGLKNQMRNASGSVMDCIAEGFEREGNKEFLQFLSISKGSCGETRSQAYRAFDYQLISETDLNQLIETTTRLSKKIAAFMSYLRTSDYKGTKFKKTTSGTQEP